MDVHSNSSLNCRILEKMRCLRSTELKGFLNKKRGNVLFDLKLLNSKTMDGMIAFMQATKRLTPVSSHPIHA